MNSSAVGGSRRRRRRYGSAATAVNSIILTLLAAALTACAPPPPPPKTAATAPTRAVARGEARIQGVNFIDALRPVAHHDSVTLAAAKNEWASFAIQISNLPASARGGQRFRLRAPLKEGTNATIEVEQFSAAQILPMPVDVNRAGFVRHTGLVAQHRPLPRALLPMKMNAGEVDLSAARNADEPMLFWIDLHVPTQTSPGDYLTTCDLRASDASEPLASVPVRITVYDFTLPEDRHLVMSGRLEWDDLVRLYPERFETVRPRLLSRDDQSYASAIRVLDSLVKLAQSHRTEVVIPRLQPTVKWPAGGEPDVDWKDFDALLAPWMTGQAFADHIALAHWPMPAPDQLSSYDQASQLQYWEAAARHYERLGWLGRMPAPIESSSPGRIGPAQSLQMSADAAQVLSAHPQLRVMLPLDQDQVQLATSERPGFIDAKTADRVHVASEGIVFNTPVQKWPSTARRPQRWLRTDVPGLVQYVGAGGDERDVRAWAWLAFLRQAGLIQWGSALPRTSLAQEPADPNDVVWFYPGSWFGIDEPVPTIQLKWLRRAQQDYEYLWLARQRGETINASLMARLMTKPVEIAPGQTPDPLYALLTGTADPQTWLEGQRLLAKVVQLREPGQDADLEKANALALELLRWSRPQETALLMGRTTGWGFALGQSDALSLTLGIDVYNASDTRPDQNLLQWTRTPRGWQRQPQPMTTPALSTYRVDRVVAQANFNLASVDAKDHTPTEISFTNGINNQTSTLKVVLPVAPSDRLGPIAKIEDAKLDDWKSADAIQNGPLVRMFNRPALQKQELQHADEQSVIYSAWADERLYLAFQLEGVSSDAAKVSRNFVDYQFRRAWGEDLAEILIQSIYDDNTLGPLLHVICKPAAGLWVERKGDARTMVDPWQPFEGSGIRYAARVDDGVWIGELAIPWRAISDREKGRPKLLRFNFSQHVHSTGQSASWAGPVDFGRDESFMGLLYIRESEP